MNRYQTILNTIIYQRNVIMSTCAQCDSVLGIYEFNHSKDGVVCDSCAGVSQKVVVNENSSMDEVNDTHVSSQENEKWSKFDSLSNTESTFVEATDLNYDEVTWFRKRWFFVLTALFFLPATILIAATGDIFMLKNGVVHKYSDKQKGTLILFAVLFMVSNILRYCAKNIY